MCNDTSVYKVTGTKVRWTVSNICSAYCVEFLIRIGTVMLGVPWACNKSYQIACFTFHVRNRGIVVGMPSSGRSWVPITPLGSTHLLTQWLESSWNMMAHGDAREGEVKGKLTNGVGSQYPSHYLGTWCIQHYYRW